MKHNLPILAAMSALAFGGAASATTLTPVYADCDAAVPAWNGTGVSCGAANDATAVNSGLPDGSFYSIGRETEGVTGVVVYELDAPYSGDVTFFDAIDPAEGVVSEAADVFVAQADAFGDYDSSTAVYVGSLFSNSGIGQTLSIAGLFQFIYIQDATGVYFPQSNSLNGYDLDSIKFGEVPLPAAALLFPMGLAGLSFMRRRRVTG
ncbi:MAG: VPLPA-CTERM sorting domain-containing protein [Parvularculaceae bacterium]